MPQLDFFNILSQLEFGLLIFISFYFFSIFFVIPTILAIFSVRSYLKAFPLQLFNSYSLVTFTTINFYFENFSVLSHEYIFNNDLYTEHMKFNEFIFNEFISTEFKLNLSTTDFS